VIAGVRLATMFVASMALAGGAGDRVFFSASVTC
jgi:hypothetical protein